MGYVLLLVLAVLLVAALVTVQVMVLPLVISGTLLAATGVAIRTLGGRAWRVLRVTGHHGASPDPPPGGPAWRPYPLGQGWRDLYVVAWRTGVRVWDKLFGLHSRFWPWAVENLGVAGLIGLPTGFGLVAGTALAAVPLAAAVVALAGVQLAVLVVWGLGWLATVATIGAAELLLRGVRRVVVACPHPGCYHRFGLPMYACSDPDCDQRHRRLFPNHFGALRHACRCGASLPTLVMLGRYRLTGFCPRCERPLPDRAGRVRIEHVPIVGGPDAGKSTFLCLGIGALTEAVTGREGVLEYPDHRDETRWTGALAELRRGVRLPKTVAELPTAVMLDIRPRRGGGRILYLFDPAGESYDAAETVDTQRYLDHAEVAVVVVDPLAIGTVADSFTDEDRQVVALAAAPHQTRVVREGPGPMVDRFTGVLRSRPAGGRLRRLLVVVSKADVLRQTSVGAGLAGPEPDVPGWLEEVGWGNWVRTLAECGGEVRYLASGLDIDDETLAGTVAWLTGLDGEGRRRLRSRLRGRLRGRPHRHRPWAASGRGERIPAGHLAGRRLAMLLGAPAALLTALAATGLLVLLLLSFY